MAVVPVVAEEAVVVIRFKAMAVVVIKINKIQKKNHYKKIGSTDDGSAQVEAEIHQHEENVYYSSLG